MRIVCIFFILVCLCVGCKGMGSQRVNDQATTRNNKIASGYIVKDTILPETGAARIKPPKEMKISEPKKLNAMEAPKILIPDKSQEPKALISKESKEPKTLLSSSGNS
jgi:hypothetical protein